MPEHLNISDKANSKLNMADIGFECGDMFHSIGNFSIVPFNGFYLASFRRFAYYITSETEEYLTCQTLSLEDPHKQLFCLLDKDFNFIKHIPCATSTFWEDPKFNRRTPYLEDMRMVNWEGNIYGISSIFYQNEKSFERFGLEFQQIDVCSKGMEGCAHVECQHRWNSIQHGIFGRHKNFMPIPDKPFFFVSGTWQNGTQLLDMKGDKFICGGTIGSEDEIYRGNTPLVETNTGYLTITHRLVFDERGRKRYINYLVEYNKDLSVRRVSRPFKLTQSNIEFVTTLLMRGDKIIIGVTEMDETPWLMVFDDS